MKQWTEVHDIAQETGIKTIPKKRKCKKAKWLSEEALQIAVKRRDVKSKGEKESGHGQMYSHGFPLPPPTVLLSFSLTPHP